LGAAIVLC